MITHFIDIFKILLLLGAINHDNLHWCNYLFIYFYTINSLFHLSERITHLGGILHNQLF